MDLGKLPRLTGDWAAELGIPGASVGVVADGEAVTAHVGVADIRSRTPIGDHTLFPLASTTKPFTATAALSLVEAGRWDLDGLIVEWAPELSQGPNESLASVTLRHLLTHSAGFEGDHPPIESSHPDVLQESVAHIARLRQLHPPGAMSSYSNAGIQLVGALVERVSGQRFGDFLTSRVLEPLGIAARIVGSHAPEPGQGVSGHGVVNGETRAVPLTFWPSENPQGGILATMDDLLRWSTFQLRGSQGARGPVSDHTRAMMQEPAVGAMAPLSAYGMPWQIRNRGDLEVIGHGGTHDNLCVTTFDLVPTLGLAVAVLANHRRGKELGRRVLDWCLAESGAADPGAPTAATATTVHRDLEEFTGRYRFGLGELVVDVVGTDLRISLDPAAWIPADVAAQIPPFLVRHRADDVFTLPRDPGQDVCRFYRDDDDSIVHLGAMGRIATRA